MSRNGTWNDEHRVALASGALAFFVLLTPVQEFDATRTDNPTGMTLVGLATLVFLLWTMANAPTNTARNHHRGDLMRRTLLVLVTLATLALACENTPAPTLPTMPVPTLPPAATRTPPAAFTAPFTVEQFDTDVEGWQGTFDDAQTGGRTKQWWVAEKDFGTGPFRWLVYQEQGGPMLAASESFDLPAFNGAIVSVEPTLKP